MSRKNSTGKLTTEQLKQQEANYAEDCEYDYIIIGTGSAALTVGALLANKGYKICMLEAHDRAGGYCHNFDMGPYTFCAQVHYIWGCQPGGVIYEFLKKCDLEDDITFELFDSDGYDHMRMPDGKVVKIPYGFDQLIQNVEDAYPGQKEQVEKFVKKLELMRDQMAKLPSKIKWWQYVTQGYKFLPLLKYRNYTLQKVFDECGLSKEAQSVLSANAGDFMLPPNRLSFILYTALFGGYNTGTFYPTKHFKFYINRLTQFVTDNEGCHIYYETEVSDIQSDGNNITSIKTKNDKTFTAKNYICNMDPQKAAKMIGWEKFPKKDRKKLSYDYSEAGVVVYLGLKNIKLKDHGFGSFNTWHLENWDMNKLWAEADKMNFEKPWFFISTATTHTKEGGVTPEDCEIMELATYVPFKPMKELKDKNPKLYRKKKMEIAEKMIDLVEKQYIPNFRDHIQLKVVGSSTTNVDYCLAPNGNAYGMEMTTKNINLGKLTAETPFSNLWWCNASSGGAGMYGTVGTGINLYQKLTDDRFYDKCEKMTDEEMVRWSRERAPKSK